MRPLMVIFSLFAFLFPSLAGAEPFETIRHPPVDGHPPAGSNYLEFSPDGEGVAPVVAVDHFSRTVENPLMLHRRHQLSALAGLKFTLLEGISLGGGAIMPLAEADEHADALIGGKRTPLGGEIRGGASLEPVGWRGDLRISIGKRFNLNLFYDTRREQAGRFGEQMREESIGTRLEFRFR